MDGFEPGLQFKRRHNDGTPECINTQVLSRIGPAGNHYRLTSSLRLSQHAQGIGKKRAIVMQHRPSTTKSIPTYHRANWPLEEVKPQGSSCTAPARTTLTQPTMTI